MNRRILTSLAIAFSLALHPLNAQSLTYGLIVGSPFTNDFGNRKTFYVNPVTGNVGDLAETSASRDYIMGGAVLEWHLSQRFSLEGNALYRALHYNETQSGPRDTVVTWELPVLFKYSLKPVARLRPFAEVGASFRTAGNLNEAIPSPVGLSAGAGLGFHFHFLDVAPAVRYTRWRADKDNLLFTKSDQLEFLVEFSHTSRIH